eukprot:gene23572-28582_t
MFTNSVSTPLGEYPGLTEVEVDKNMEKAISDTVVFAVDITLQKRKFSSITDQHVATTSSNAFKVLRRAFPDPAQATMGQNVDSLVAHLGVNLGGPIPEASHEVRISALERKLENREKAEPDVPAEQLAVKQLLFRLVDTVAAVRDEVATLRDEVAVMSARIDNAPRRSRNLLAAANQELMPLVVETVSSGGPPLGALPPAGLFPYPLTKNALYRLSEPAICPIREFYRFPHQEAGATLDELRQELLCFLEESASPELGNVSCVHDSLERLLIVNCHY